MRIFISGATGDLGGFLASQIAKKGHSLYLTSRCGDKLRKQSDSLKLHSASQVQYKAANLTLSSEVNQLCNNIENFATPLHGAVLIYPQIEKPDQIFPSEDMWENNFKTCFTRPLRVLEAVTNTMHEGGRIVIVSGIASAQVFPRLALTNAIRNAWTAQAKTLAFALGRQKIHINTVSLGALDTPRIRDKADALDRQNLSYAREDFSSALGRMGSLQSASHLIEALLGHASDHVTGANILCDGGFCRHY